MRLKVFQAPNIGAAMTMVRAELGSDALILASRSVDGGVEVTAAREVAQPPEPLADQARVDSLRWHGLPDPLAAKLSSGDLTAALASQFRFAALDCRTGSDPLLLVGPPGAGKTLTTARIATRLVLAGQSAHIITADGKRAGAAEQLAAFTRLLGLTLIAADTPLTLARAVARRTDGAPVVIDTPGLNPADPADRDILRELHAVAGGTIALVLPAGLDSAEAKDIASEFRSLGATVLIATRLDQSRRLGGILAAAGVGLGLTEAGIGPGVADGLCRITAEFLAKRLGAGPAKPPPISPLAAMARARELQRPSS